jgi:hypothetical protein
MRATVWEDDLGTKMEVVEIPTSCSSRRRSTTTS